MKKNQSFLDTTMVKNIAIIENHIISANTVRRRLIEVLMESNYNVFILSTGTDEEFLLAKARGFQVINVGSSNTNPLHVTKYIRNIKKALREYKADVCLTFTMRPAIWGNLVTRQLKIPTITNITGIGPLEKSNSIAYKVARTLYKGMLRKTNVVYFQNEDDCQIFLRNGYVKQDQAKLIPGSGVDINYFSPAEEEIVEKENFTFLFISRLIKDKGILEFVEAARKLNNEYSHVKCQVVGPYYNQNLKDNIITEGDIEEWSSQGIVEYLGAVHDVRPRIAAADCIVLPSYREGMSNVLLEAASMQKPCIASNVTGCKEIIDDGITGFLCEVKNAADLAEKMKQMIRLSRAEREQMGINARKRVSRLFNKEIVINSYRQELDKILNK